jgi:hypothetical protein
MATFVLVRSAVAVPRFGRTGGVVLFGTGSGVGDCTVARLSRSVPSPATFAP